MNYGEGRELAERMEALGNIPSETADDADIVILNTCTVVDTTEKRMIKRMNELKAAGKKVIVTGCMAKVQPGRIRIRLPDSIIVPPEDYGDFSRRVSDAYGCGKPISGSKSDITSILPIAQGCRGNCTYCITRFARGTLCSYPSDAMRNRFDMLVDSGAREVLVTAQDTGCYGRDIGTDLGKLIGSFLNKEGEYRIRIGMMNPNSLRPVLDSVLGIFEDDRVYRFLHIPVQSGSDAVLENMKRHYTSEDFFELVDMIRESYPEMSIATDLIAGFPGETDEDQIASEDLIRKLRADTVNITRFSPRPGTEAFSMPQINGRILKDRSTRLTEIKNETEADVNSGLVGKTFRSLVTERSSDGSFICRTDNYRPIAVRDDVSLGEFVTADVTDCRSTYLMGNIVKPS